MLRALKLANPNDLFERPEIFEKAMAKFLLFLKSRNEQGEALAAICRDLVITYEKIYHSSEFRRPLGKIYDIETGLLLYLKLDDSTIYIGKIMEKSEEKLTLILFRGLRELRPLAKERSIWVYIWRLGDAEYLFQSKAERLKGSLL